MVEAAESARVNRDELLGRLGRAFGRREPRLQAGTYVDGLMSDTPRKNGWSLAERAGDRTPDRMQRLLNHAVWDEHEAMGIVGDFVVEHFGRPGRGRGPRRDRAGEEGRARVLDSDDELVREKARHQLEKS